MKLSSDRIKSYLTYALVYSIIALVGILVMINFVPDKFDLVHLFLVIIVFAAVVSASSVLVLIWVARDTALKQIAIIIQEYEDLFEDAISTIEFNLVHHTAFEEIDKIRQNPTEFIEDKTKSFIEQLDFDGTRLSLVREILIAEFQKRLKVLLQKPKEPTQEEMKAAYYHQHYPRD